MRYTLIRSYMHLLKEEGDVQLRTSNFFSTSIYTSLLPYIKFEIGGPLSGYPYPKRRSKGGIGKLFIVDFLKIFHHQMCPSGGYPHQTIYALSFQSIKECFGKSINHMNL